MIIGVPKEIKNNESRVALVPDAVATLIKEKHEVYVEKNAGLGSGFADAEYKAHGAKIVDAKKAWSADLVIKVKEPQTSEFKFFREGLILFTYLHLAAEPKLKTALLKSKVCAIAYETVQYGRITPLLRPMSEVAGRRAVIVGAFYQAKMYGGQGFLLGGTPGTLKGLVTVVGGGVAGTAAANLAAGFGCRVKILESNEEQIRHLVETMPASVEVLKSTPKNIFESTKVADVIISTVLIPGAKAPKLITTKMVKEMKKGAIIVDVAIDQGGSVETIDRITTHDNPIYEKFGVLHYSVANIPGATPRTSTYALTNATFPYLQALSKYGVEGACERYPELTPGINTCNGKIVNKSIGK